ncbi:G3E family GTPase [Burkholderia ambifaria]
MRKAAKRRSKPCWNETSGLRARGVREWRAVRREHSRRMGGVRAQQVARHHRHERARQHERRDHREDHGFGHRHEQEARDAVEQQHRHEHDADAQQRHERGRDDLRRAVEDRAADVLALFEMPVHVLDRDGRIVDENADRERKPAERHHVERLARGGERGDRRQHRERN